MSQVERKKIPAILLSLDAEKAFDRIHWGFIFRTLHKFGLTGNIATAIAALYSQPSARVLANGVLSKPFQITNGTRQGCPLSPLIFDLIMEPLAEAIRSHAGIKGVDIAGIQHKISLFADDVILALTDVKRSLANVSSLLDLYGSLTYYKVNSAKPLVLGLALPPGVQRRLKSAFPYTWQDTSLPYLGIHLPKKLSQLVNANFPTLLKSVRADIDRISKVENTWWGRIVLYKMLILPKILYAFWTLPVTIPNTIFKQFHTQMNAYVWQNRRPRLSFSLMSKRPRKGGLGLPKLQAYHFAMTLAQVKHWWKGSKSKAWVCMEADCMGIKDLKGALLDPIANPLFPAHITPTITTTLNYWKTVFMKRCPQPGISHASIPLGFLPLHIPHLNITPWAQKGLTLLEDLYDGVSIRPFDDLQEQYGLLNSDRYKYDQVTHLLKQVASKQRAMPSSVLSYLSAPPSSTMKGSRIFYDFYTGNDIFSKTNNMVKWEEELNRYFTTAQWQSAISWAHRSSSCASHKEQSRI